jgi:hypothetical protein
LARAFQDEEGAKMRSHVVRMCLAAAAIAVLLTPVASAAPPANDDFDNATTITALPASVSVDMAEATAAGDDPTMSCNPDAPPFTVWYAFTPPTNMRLRLDVSFVETVFGVSVYAGSRGNLSEVACLIGADTRFFDVAAGTTYYFMVWSFAPVVMHFDLSEVLPPPSIALDINAKGSVNPTTGVATVRGTVTCSRAVVLESVQVDLSQLFARRVTIVGSGFTENVPCTPSGNAWSVAVDGTNGRFGAGSATATARTQFCNAEGSCTLPSLTKSIRLRGA